jgi:hypothetical protein
LKRVPHLRTVYTHLHEKKVPHTDAFVRAYDTTVILSPRGNAVQPRTEKELVGALVCVLEALEVSAWVIHEESTHSQQALHRPQPIFHRDIRWSNVIQKLDNPQCWFIIDWDDATWPPTKGASHFHKNSHAPSVHSDGHGAEVDIWGVGELIQTCTASDISPELKALGDWMKGVIAPSAQDALSRVKAYQLSRLQLL